MLYPCRFFSWLPSKCRFFFFQFDIKLHGSPYFNFPKQNVNELNQWLSAIRKVSIYNERMLPSFHPGVHRSGKWTCCLQADRAGNLPDVLIYVQDTRIFVGNFQTPLCYFTKVWLAVFDALSKSILFTHRLARGIKHFTFFSAPTLQVWLLLRLFHWLLYTN